MVLINPGPIIIIGHRSSLLTPYMWAMLVNFLFVSSYLIFNLYSWVVLNNRYLWVSHEQNARPDQRLITLITIITIITIVTIITLITLHEQNARPDQRLNHFQGTRGICRLLGLLGSFGLLGLLATEPLPGYLGNMQVIRVIRVIWVISD